jgi:hypothetical protein
MTYKKHPPPPPSKGFWLAVAAVAVVVFGLIVIVRATAAPTPQGAKRVICHVFQERCPEALRVADCETGGTFSVWAGYGKHQYLGLFQMGSWERRTFGHGNDAWEQSRAAHRYFVASGRDWSPWECQP